MAGTPRQTFRIDEYVWKQFIKKCESKGYTASDVLRAFIMEVVKGTLSPDSVHPSKNSKGEALQRTEDEILKWFSQNKHTVKED